ncbi:MAG: hypothetical protein JWN04_3558 [Myxococcaceae bacterium]|nr:hypothetical protein [Myxococcaceae bacterium]
MCAASLSHAASDHQRQRPEEVKHVNETHEPRSRKHTGSAAQPSIRLVVKAFGDRDVGREVRFNKNLDLVPRLVRAPKRRPAKSRRALDAFPPVANEIKHAMPVGRHLRDIRRNSRRCAAHSVVNDLAIHDISQYQHADACIKVKLQGISFEHEHSVNRQTPSFPSLGLAQLRAPLLLFLLILMPPVLCCSRSETPQTKPSDAALGRQKTCGRHLYAGFPDPQEAYGRYAETINAGRWCEAINTFTPAARPSAAMAMFRVLLVLSVAENPRRADYRATLQQFCSARQLGCEAEERIMQIGLEAMNREPIDADVPRLGLLLTEVPEDIFVELMTRFASVDTQALSSFNTPLIELQVHGDRAVGKAPQRDGPANELAFVRSSAGWLLQLE